MGRCIICGTSVDGRICDTHEEDVAFEFRGDQPSQLTTDRFYEGTVDGYADFGVFVDIGDHVTGLLHQSEIDQRLESLDWEPGDDVFVKVLRVQDNGNVDLGWSIRQDDRDFRGRLVDDPTEEHATLPEEDEEGNEHAADAGAAPAEAASTDASGDTGPSEDADDADPSEDADDVDASEDADDGGLSDDAAAAIADEPVADDEGDQTADATGSAPTDGGETPADGGGGAVVAEREDDADDGEGVPERVGIETLGDHVDERVTVEGEVAEARQTGGPTIFEVRDETGTVDVAAFDGAGVRAYPDVEAGASVRVVGEVEVRRDELQVESESVEQLDGADADAVDERLTNALEERARPDAVDPLADHDAVTAVAADLQDAATVLRKAVFGARPIVVRHPATADGYVAGAAIERAVLPLVREEHGRADAEYHYFDRRPLDDPVYGMPDATVDVSNMLEDRERHDEALPLVVLAGVGATGESMEALSFLDVYDVDAVVVDPDDGDEAVAETAAATVVPSLAGADGRDATTTALAANLAAHVNADVRADLRHLPAVSYWEDAPAEYVDLARAAGYDEVATTDLREALALAAYYQTYEDKRQLVTDLLFGGAPTDGDARGLAEHVSEQFREQAEEAVDVAAANAEVREAGGVRFTVLDAEAFADGYEFPPTELLADLLHRRDRGEADRQVTVVLTTDELHLRGDDPLDVRAVAERVDDAVDDAGVHAVGGRDGHVAFVAGEREAVLKSAVQAVAELL
jgi:RecJ-like exonuclease